MDYEKRNRQIANSFYNLGLEKANVRDLSGAVESLKKSLHFDKYQMDARNLLGLIYYEMGEVSDALVQWVISTNLHPADNPADRYLDEIQRKPGRLEIADQNVKKYNQALWYAQHDSDDLAILQLTRVVEDNPHFVKAHLLLAVLYMYHEDFSKAGRSLYKVLQIDKNNPKAQWYMSIVKKNTGKAEVEKRKLKNAFSHHQMQDDDVIMPPTYKENTGWQSILNILAGLILGVMVTYFLIMPPSTRALSNKHNEEIITYSQKLNEKNQELDALQASYDELKAQSQDMENKLNTIEGDTGQVLKQYQTMIGILQAYRNEDIMSVAKLYVDLDPSLIVDESVLEIANAVAADMQTKGYQTLEDLGTAAWNSGQKDQAMEYYQKSLEINPNNPSATYLLGRLYQDRGDTENARQCFSRIITSFPESPQASQAANAMSQMGLPTAAAGQNETEAAGEENGDAGDEGGAESEPQNAENSENGDAGDTDNPAEETDRQEPQTQAPAQTQEQQTEPAQPEEETPETIPANEIN
ncbi:MAG: tetratricopeptide repeat protein [Lachnospiraceae bacterium]